MYCFVTYVVAIIIIIIIIVIIITIIIINIIIIIINLLLLLLLLLLLYYFMRNFCKLIGLEQWYFSWIWNAYMWKLETFFGSSITK